VRFVPENLVLRRQLAWYLERGINSRRMDHATRVSLSVFSRLFNWRDAIVIVRPSTYCSLAPTGLADLLAVEVQGGPAADTSGATGPDLPDGHGEPALG
jgi:hypothetical protein